MTSALFFGDNLDVLQRHVDDESVDLVYLDPPFNSNQDYNVLFADRSGTRAAAQIKAFGDTWRWDIASAEAYQLAVESGGQVSRALQAFRGFLGESDMLAYLSMMASRVVELRRVMKSTASIYLHCDPTASHYLKILLDAVFGPENFQNEIVWQRTQAHNMKTKRFGRVNDALLFCSKTDNYIFNEVYTPYSDAQLKRYKEDKNGQTYKAENLTFSTANPSRQFEWRGAKPPPHRSWGASREQLEKWYEEGRILLKKDGTPRLDGLKVYLNEMPGKLASSNWADIPRIGNTSAERLGYQTQKPEALLERIISASSSEGDTVLDPFCGCGTTVSVAQRLKRKWIGIDITHLAVQLIKQRLRDSFGNEIDDEYDVIGEPVTVAGAQELADNDPWQFQYWALGLVRARPAGQKKGPDQGIDGRIYFHDSTSSDAETREIIISVKAGKTGVAHVRDLRGVIERENAKIGVLISMQVQTIPMRKEAVSAGFYTSPWGKHPRLQLLTITELLDSKGIDYPPSRQVDDTFKRAPKVKRAESQTDDLFSN